MARPSDPVSNRNANFIVLASTCVLIAAMYFLRDVLIPLALAVLVTFLLTPIASKLQRWKLGRVGSVAAVMSVLLLSVVVLGWIVAGQVWQLAAELPHYKDDIAAKLQRLKPGEGGVFDRLSRSVDEVEKKIDQPSTAPATQSSDVIAQGVAAATDREETVETLDDATASATTQNSAVNPVWVKPVPADPSPFDELSTYLGLVLGPLGTAGIVIVVVLFMLLQREDLRDRLIRLVGHGQMNLTTTALDDAGTRISRYLLAQAIVNGTYGIAVALGLWLIGMIFGDKSFPNFILWGLLCALLRFVPYIGPWIAAAFPMLVAFAVYKGFGVFGATVIFFVVLELLSNNVMEPILYGSSTGMSAVAILVAAVFWTFLWGPIGLLLATPLTVCLVVLGKYVPQLQFLDILLGDEPVLEPHERVYQRLLALDEEEATETTVEYLETMSLEQVYDSVLLPALALAEQDRHRGNLDEERWIFIRRVMRILIEELRERQDLIDQQAEAAKAKVEEKVQADEIKAEAKAVVAASKAAPVDPPVPQPVPATPRAHRGNVGAAAPGGVGSGLVAKLASVGSAIGSGMMSKAAEKAVAESRTRLPQGCIVNVVCLPAHDEADEIVGLMLVQLLEREGFCASSVSVDALASEMVEQVAQREAQIVCVSAIPPAAVAHSRYLCKRLHARFPDIDMIVGLWAYKGNFERAKERITCERAVSIHTTLAEAMSNLHQIAQPIIFRSEKSNAPTDEAPR